MESGRSQTRAGPRPNRKPVFPLRLTENPSSQLRREEFLKRVRAWAANTVPDHKVQISMSTVEKRHRAGVYKYRFSCTDCTKCSWRGYASYCTSANQLEIKAKAITAHKNFTESAVRRSLRGKRTPSCKLCCVI